MTFAKSLSSSASERALADYRDDHGRLHSNLFLIYNLLLSNGTR